MRKIVLTSNDFELFDTEIGSVEFEFFHKHKDAFKRMWREQGRKFWIQFVMSYRQYAVDFGTIKEFPAKNEHFEDFVDQAFIVIHENFVEGKFGSARSFITDIVLVAQNRHTLQYLESKSYAKDPFYNKETRDVFRRLFGPPHEKSSYLKVYILFPIYMKYAGAVCICLRRWLDASDVPSDEETSPTTKSDPKGSFQQSKSSSNHSSTNGSISPTLLDPDELIYGTLPTDSPKIIVLEDDEKSDKDKGEKDMYGEKGDITKADTKFRVDEADNKEKDKGKVGVEADRGVGVDKGSSIDRTNKGNGDGDKPDKGKVLEKEYEVDEMETITTSGARKAIREGGGDGRRPYAHLSDSDELESLCYEGPERMHRQMERRRMMMEERRMEFFEDDEEYFKMYIREVKDGSRKGPLFVRGWPKEVDPRQIDPENPLYSPTNRNSDWKEGLRLPYFAKFVKYVRANYRRGAKMSDGEKQHVEKMRQIEQLKDSQMEENIARALAKQTPGIKTEGFTIKLEDSKLKESQDEKKRKRKIKKRMKKGLPVNSNELTPVNGASNSIIKGPIPVLMPHPRSEPRQSPKLRHVEPQLVERRRDMDMVAPPKIEPNSVKLTKKVDDKKGTVTLTVEKRDGKGNTTTETTVKPLNSEDDKSIWEEAMAKLNPPTGPKSILNKDVQREIAEKMSKQNTMKSGTANCETNTSMDFVNKTNSSSQTPSPMAEDDKKQFREMYKEISAAIGEVSRHNQLEDEPKGSSFQCQHGTRHEKARNRLRRKLGERVQERKHPELPGLVRLGGAIEYPIDENEAMMMTLSEMTKMNSKEKELFQEKLGRTKYFKDQDDPRDVFDSMNQFLMPGIKGILKDEKSKNKKAKVREKEKEEMEKLKQADNKSDNKSTEAKEESSDGTTAKTADTQPVPVENGSDHTSKMDDTKLNEASVKKTDTGTEDSNSGKDKSDAAVDKQSKKAESGVKSEKKEETERDNVRMMDLKDQVKQMKTDVDLNQKKMNLILNSELWQKESPQRSGQFEKQVSRVNREIQNIERRILLLDEDCQKLDNIDFRNNLQQASEELNRVKVKVKQWEHDTALLRESIPKSDGERLFDTVMKVAEVTREALMEGENIEEEIDISYDTHPPWHPEVTPDILEKSMKREVDQDKVLRDFADLIQDETVLGIEVKGTIPSPRKDTSKKTESCDDSDTLKEQSIRDLDRVMEVVAEEHRKEMRQKMKMKEQIEEGERERAHRQRAAEKNRQKKEAAEDEKKFFTHAPNTLLEEVTKPKIKTSDSAKQDSKKDQTVEMISRKLSHPVGGRVADNRTAQQKLQDAERYPEKSLPAKKSLKSPEKKAKNGASSDTRETKKAKDVKDSSKSSSKSLKICSGCGNTEPSPKVFKKCQKCKQEQVKNSRYYCGRECQGEDWKKRHKLEHKEKRLE